MWIARAVITVFLFDGVTSIFFQTRHRQTRPGCVSGVTSSQAYSITAGYSDMSQFYLDLNSILVARVPDTPGHTQVKQYIAGRMGSLGWTVEEDSFVDTTPRGPTTFTNVIATWNPSAPKRIIVACHYDSKSFQGFVFLGATDSAVPCALMIDSAAKLQTFLAEVNLAQLPDTTLQFIFFDGEEAFQRWSDNDSLYGSRHLANRWKVQTDPNDSNASNYLQNIDVFVLLDLIGTRDTSIKKPFQVQSGRSHFNTLSSIESCLRRKRWLPFPYRRIFNYWGYSQRIEDDHIPFMQEGVKTLHLISSPFPVVWHTSRDNAGSLDANLIRNFAAIFRLFLTSIITTA